ncbi:MAG: 23S rRNA (pseudouridine(1915)-N(3))-methyltransferase RlmH [Proteobacteria bacterium]|nr:23S rRNA (pseudouridine(1915)-N(3))-methyltransferase RlmH [Pseudomonadota bacterium]
MRMTVVAVGRARRGPESELFNLYAARLSPPLNLTEVEEKRPLAGEALKRREAELLGLKIPTGALLVALDERGSALTSRELARRIQGWADEGRREVAFVIGGAGGLDSEFRASASLVLSLGPATWPHLMVRAMLAEQLYRAQTIVAGHPYHRD